MKKNIISLSMALALSFCAFLSGCACSDNSQLAFNLALETEKLTYTVEYSEHYVDSYKKDPTVTADFNYGKGIYVTECQKVTDRSAITSDIKESLNEMDIYKYTSDFGIDIQYTVGDKTYSHRETISTLIYLAPSGMSLAPLYATENAEYVMFADGDSGAQASILKSQTETFYNKSEYVQSKKYQYFKPDDEIAFTDATDTENKENYTFRSTIDNAELYLAMRGLSIAENASTVMSVVSPSFKDPSKLKITNNGRTSETFDIEYNGTALSESISYVDLSFRLSDVNASGKTQNVFIQADGTANLPNLKIPLKFAKPLFLYGNIKTMGCLVFTISEIER